MMKILIVTLALVILAGCSFKASFSGPDMKAEHFSETRTIEN